MSFRSLLPPLVAGLALVFAACAGAKPRNIVFILVDDQRYDAISALGHPFLETPAADSLIRNGTRFANAYVTTALCSPSRATILTGLYAHTHRIVDNQSGMPPGLRFFSQDLQQAGYRTAFLGKWHMGDDSDKPRPGWSHWVSFSGQGSYFPDLPNGRKAQLNVDGKHVPQTAYITDELTDYALRWLREQQGGDAPWMLYLSHKAVHYDFTPAPRHKGRYAKSEVKPFPSSKDTPLDKLKPMWARNQRNSWHGAEYPFHNTQGEVNDIYRRYCETLLAVDESTQRVIDFLRDTGQLESTLIIYMGDNGHLWGEQSLIDKRNAYEASIRVPLIVHCPEIVPAGRVVKEMVANLDIAPTVLDAAEVKPPPVYQGRSFLPLARGESVADWRTELLYEYFWERWAPSTPTLHALITPRWKYARAYGVWDVSELYDLENDPHELSNLFAEPEHRARAMAMDKRLFELLAETGGGSIPLLRGWNGSAKEERSPYASEWAPFPQSMVSVVSGLNEPLLGGSSAQTPLDPGQFTSAGWNVTSENSQLMWDLGRHYDEGTIEFEARGDWLTEDKCVIFALWNVPEGTETNASRQRLKRAALFQLRLMDEGMMLRLTASGQAKTIEKHTGVLTWPGRDRWVHIKATFTTRNGGICRLWRDGIEIRNGSLRGNVAPGFRYVFLGRDNYKDGYVAIPGFMFRNLRIYNLK
mgnify:CR=1 FL=1